MRARQFRLEDAGRSSTANRKDDISRLLLRFDVPGRVDHVFQRIGPVDDRPVLSGLEELLEEEDVLLRVSRWYREDHFLVSDPRGPQRQDEIPQPVGRQIAAAGLQRAPASPERVLADRVEDDVIRLAVLGEVFPGVIDDSVGSERSHELEVLRIADRCDVGFEVLGQLHPRGADGPGCAIYEDPLPLPEICQSQAPQCIEGSVAYRRSLLEGHTGRLVCDSSAFPHADELRMCPEAETTRAEDVVTDRELGDGCASCFDLPRQLGAQDPLPRSADARDEPADYRDEHAATPVGLACRAVRPGDRRGVDPDEYFVLLGNGPVDVFESQHVRGSVPVVDNCPHESPILLSLGCDPGRYSPSKTGRWAESGL